jgi:hypothetical protein
MLPKLLHPTSIIAGGGTWATRQHTCCAYQSNTSVIRASCTWGCPVVLVICLQVEVAEALYMSTKQGASGGSGASTPNRRGGATTPTPGHKAGTATPQACTPVALRVCCITTALNYIRPFFIAAPELAARPHY